MAPWKTRRVAADTRSLPLEGARWVDEQLAARVDGFGLPTIERIVALAAARYAPEEQAAKEQAGRAGWHVTLTHPRPGDFAGTSWLDMAGDTTDLTAFHDLVCAEAKLLGRLGDADDYETRKAKALGVIAARQGHLDLTVERGHRGRRPAARSGAATTLYLHLSLADLAAAPRRRHPAVGEAERLGPVTTDLIRNWLQTPSANIRPVLDLQPHRRRGPARPTALDARAGHPPRPALRLPLVRPATPAPATSTTSSPTTTRTTRPDQTRQPRAIVQATSPGQDLRTWRYDLPRQDPAAPTPGPTPTATPSASAPTAPTHAPGHRAHGSAAYTLAT